MNPVYDRIGDTYQATRKSEPRFATAIAAALGNAESVVNVGAGTGSYEPTDREVLAVEPSTAMIAQRPHGSAPAMQASAEALPLGEHIFDAALAVNTVHHWTDLRAGLRELRRVARKRVVIFMRIPQQGVPFWLVDDYLPALDPSQRMGAIAATIGREFPQLTLHAVPLPRACDDGVFTGYWARPEMYLDPDIRRNISNFALAPDDDVADGLVRLQADLESGTWDERYGHLRTLPELDLGHRIIVAEVG